MSKISADYLEEQFGNIKFGEESSISYSDFERSLNSYLKEKNVPHYNDYMVQEGSNGPKIDDFEESYDEILY